MVWSPSHGDTAFTVPLFDQFSLVGASERTSRLSCSAMSPERCGPDPLEAQFAFVSADIDAAVLDARGAPAVDFGRLVLAGPG